ncbi:MAG: hypothetical protein Unbinned8596contig1000_23 [Prokaryotic dsDNA virus sp.]|nr:MAG: hypothetical protein Unbinned8596contig1000_23 [Prokaryotic dsDNA virus sp.]
MVGLSLDEYLASEPSTTLMDRHNVVAKILKQAVKRPSNKTIAKRTGLTVNQVEYVFRTFPEVREMRRRFR